jgi:hypothetical protein
MMKRGHGRLALIEAPPASTGIEREFYSHLVERMASASYRRTRLCLWHARYGGIASQWMGEALAARCDTAIDDIVLSLGSGSTLQGFALPLKRRLAGRPRIILSEHEKSALFDSAPLLGHLRASTQPEACEFREAPPRLPHAVIGPHYDEINPFRPSEDRAQVDGTIRYSESSWQETSRLCSAAGISVGNSSAANLAVACSLAAAGRTVLTYLYEPLRSFYLLESNELAQSAPAHRAPYGGGVPERLSFSN